MEEIWKNYDENYEVSNLGRVRNAKHAIKNGLWDNQLYYARNLNNRKAIIGTNLDTKETLEFKSVAEAERKFGKHVVDVLKGRRSQTHGYSFKYKEVM